MLPLLGEAGRNVDVHSTNTGVELWTFMSLIIVFTSVVKKREEKSKFSRVQEVDRWAGEHFPYDWKSCSSFRTEN